MTTIKQRITNCLWFNTQAEEAAQLYTSIFKNSRIVHTTRYTEEGFEIHKKRAGEVMTVEFILDGQEFVGLNGGPQFPFTEAISLTVNCADQAEIDYYWSRLSEGGEEGPCGWLKDKFGLSWQVSPVELNDMLKDKDGKKVQRVTEAFLRMKKFDLKKLRAAFEGK